MPWADRESNRSEFLRLLAPKAGERILDVGAGKGAVAALVASRGGEVYALEPDQKRVGYMRREFPAVKSSSGRSEEIPHPDAYFDKVYSTLAFHHFSDQRRSVREFARVLKPRGVLLIAEIQPGSAAGRVLRFFENGVRRANLRFLTADGMAKALEEEGLFEVESRSDSSNVYFIECVRKEG